MELMNGFTRQQIGSCISPRKLDLTLLPTEKCNFRCVYCYEEFEHGAMPPHVVEGVCNLITRRAETGLENLSLSWFGGEPLLALKVVRAISQHALLESERFRFKLRGGFTTNAYTLTTDLLAELVALKQSFFQITLDGWRDAHDSTRIRADGKGTFDVIWRNLLAARDTKLDFRIALRLHITNTNHSSLATLCSAIGQEFGKDSRFHVDFQDVRDMGGENGARVSAVPANEFKMIKQHLRSMVKEGEPQVTMSEKPEIPLVIIGRATTTTADNEINNIHPRGESAGSRFDYSDGEAYICYAAKPNHFLIRANGRIGKCTVALNDARNDLGFIRPDGTIAVNQDLARLWSRGLETLNQNTLGCPIQAWPTSSAASHTRQEPVIEAVRLYGNSGVSENEDRP